MPLGDERRYCFQLKYTSGKGSLDALRQGNAKGMFNREKLSLDICSEVGLFCQQLCYHLPIYVCAAHHRAGRGEDASLLLGEQKMG